jgi:RecA-family ATPase/5S rRNA maturation endonuclease (ribonuclease M5)
MYLDLYRQYLKGFRQTGASSQYIALCPYHEDSKASFSINVDKGVWNCKACGIQGNAYKFAKHMNLPNPNQYIVDDKVSFKANPVDRRKQHGSPRENLNKKMDEFKSNLKNNMDKFPKYQWNTKFIDDIGIGIDNNGNLAFGYYDSDICTGIKIHKQRTIGDGRCRWYLGHKIESYSTDSQLIICEGEKDALTLLTHDLQAVSGTAGAMSIPKNNNEDYDLEWLDRFKEVIICYDNDDSGINGSKRLADTIIKALPHLDISIAQWDKNLPKGFDIYDAFETDRMIFMEALANAREVEKDNKIGGFELITGYNATNMEVIPKRQIIENLIPEKSQILLGGTTGANKSYMAMQMGMSIANNEKEFLGFKINVQGLKVLYMDTECGRDVLVTRYKQIQKNFNWNADSRFTLLPRTTTSDDYADLEDAIKRVKPDIVFIDCLYNTMDGVDASKNHHIIPTTNKITEIKNRYNVTIIAIHHMNKGGHELGLTKDRMSGGSALQNWSEHLMLISRTNQTHTRLIKIDKSRHIDYPECYYELDWDAQNQILTNKGICQDWKKLLLTDQKKDSWEKVLRDLADEFTTNDFRNIVEAKMLHSERTAHNWLSDMLKCKVIEKVKHGTYKKKLELIKCEE